MKDSAKANVLFTCGAIFTIVGIILAAIIVPVFNNVVAKMVVIEEGTATFDSWIEPPVPVYLKLYLFNVTNPNEIRFYGATPILQEVGPYVYLEKWSKEDISFEDADGTVTYSDKIVYTFQEQLSIGPENETVVVINPVMTLMAAMFYNNKLVTELIWPEIEQQMDLFEEHSIGELFFDGWDLPTFDFQISDQPSCRQGNLHEILECLKIPHPDILVHNKIAILYTSNATIGDQITVNTGENDLETYLFIQKYGNMTELDYWNDPYCNMINGSDGTQYPPFLHREDVPRLFMADLCRSLYFEYEKDTQVHELVDTFRFVPPQEMLSDPNTYPPNFCYCTKVYEGDDKCLGSGFLNLAPCTGVPVVMSGPHFYLGDEEERRKLIGLSPDKQKHETFLDIEPITGVVLRAEKRIQFNFALRRYGILPTFQNVPEVIVPMFWISEGAELSRSDAEDMNKLFTLPFAIAYSLAGVLILIGLLMFYGAIHTRKQITRKDLMMKSLLKNPTNHG